MCLGGKQPAAPIATPSYTQSESDKYFNVTMGEGDNQKTLSERTAEENRKATGYGN